jgi:diaminopimelate epimerase
MNFHFFKMQGCGNDFLLLDYISETDPPRFSESEIQFFCDRNYGIGADGVVMLAKSQIAHAKWTFFNCDGSEAEMCGNAARCAVRYMTEKYGAGQSEMIHIETQVGILKGKCLPDENLVEVSLMPDRPLKIEYEDVTLRVGDDVVQAYFLNTGVPHAVVQVRDIRKYPVTKIGKALVAHAAFGAEGTNVTFFEEGIGQKIFATTFERGVEKETLACGTGAAAAAIVYSQLYLQPLPIEVSVPGGLLYVDTSPVSKVLLLRGPAEHVVQIDLPEVLPYEKMKLFGVDSQ